MEWLFSHRSKDGFPLTDAAVCCMHWIFYGIFNFLIVFYCAWIVLCLYARCTVFPIPSDFIAIQSLSFVILYCILYILPSYCMYIECILSVYCIVLCLYCILCVYCVYMELYRILCILCAYCMHSVPDGQWLYCHSQDLLLTYSDLRMCVLSFIRIGRRNIWAIFFEPEAR